MLDEATHLEHIFVNVFGHTLASYAILCKGISKLTKVFQATRLRISVHVHSNTINFLVLKNTFLKKALVTLSSA